MDFCEEIRICCRFAAKFGLQDKVELGTLANIKHARKADKESHGPAPITRVRHSKVDPGDQIFILFIFGSPGFILPFVMLVARTPNGLKPKYAGIITSPYG